MSLAGMFTGGTSGALSGAGAGSMFGPWGSAIGGVLGGLSGLLQGSQQGKGGGGTGGPDAPQGNPFALGNINEIIAQRNKTQANIEGTPTSPSAASPAGSYTVPGMNYSSLSSEGKPITIPGSSSMTANASGAGGS